MPIIEPEDPNLKKLSGIHLWHANMSSCSQRVRLALAEKNLKFESRLIDLAAGENATADYQKIHPKGVVPAAVIDGKLIIESMDIIEEVNRRFAQHSLQPDSVADVATKQELMARADVSQPNLKLLTFEFLFRTAPPPTQASRQFFQENHRNEALKKFHRDFECGFEGCSIDAAVNETHGDLIYLNDVLSDGRRWIAGDAFSLADIAWAPNLHRFYLLDWPLHHYPFLLGWYDRIRERKSFESAILRWEPVEFLQTAKAGVARRKAKGDGVEQYGVLAQFSAEP